MTKPFVVSGRYNGIPITIYGEIHNRIDQSFYEGLNLDNATVWVEHSTRLCELLHGEEKLFNGVKGLEWVWFTRTIQKKPIRCIDYRIEMGLMSRVEELQLEDQLEHIGNDDMMIDAVEALVGQFKNMLTVLKETKHIWKERSTDVNPIKSRMLDRCEDMLAHLPKVLNKSNPFEEMYEKCRNVYEDLCLMGSMLLDTVLIQEVKEYTGNQPIHLFVGLNHAIRLQHWLQLNVHSFTYDKYANNVLTNLASYTRKLKRTRRKTVDNTPKRKTPKGHNTF